MNMLYEMCGSFEALGKNVALKGISFTITENNDLWHRRWGGGILEPVFTRI